MKYEAVQGRSFRDDDKGPELMANFVAFITTETRIVDGVSSRTVLTVTGVMPPPGDLTAETELVKLPPVEVDTEEFASMSWVVPNWGVRCVIRPGGGVKDDLRTMIQLQSNPEVRTVYRQTGWTGRGNSRMYLHVGGAITARGNDPSVSVRLPVELQRFDLSAKVEPKDAVRASLLLLDVVRHDVSWPLLAATLTPLYGQCDFAMHVTGRTGSFKSELLSLFQSHYGPTMDARHLPGSWSSTPNAIEALAFYACNAAFVLDDFVPAGTSWQQRAYQQAADKIIRAQGNQAGRARLSDTSNLQQTMFPRGVILSTGEDTPEGHSVRARMLISELSAGEIDADDLTAAQKRRPLYCGTVAWLAQVLAGTPHDLSPRIEELRAAYRGIGHSRTPGMLGRLVATAEHFLATAAEHGLIGAGDARSLAKDAKDSIELAGGRQQSFLEDADPVDVFNAAVRQVFAAGLGHVKTLNGGVPAKAEMLGWSRESATGEMATFRSRGPCIGWASVPKDELFIDVTLGYKIIQKAAGNDLALSKQTLFKRLKDAGVLTRADEARSRNTIRVTAENHPRQVLCLSLSTTLQLEDVSDEYDDDRNAA